MKRTIAITLAALLAGCAAAGPDFKPPAAPQESRYTATAPQRADDDAATQRIEPGARLDRSWWRLFRSPAIDGVVKQALAHNRTLAAAGYTLAQEQALAAAQSGARAPQVDLTAGIGRQKYGAEFLGDSPKPPSFTYYAVGPTVSYDLDYTGGAERTVERQYALVDYRRQQLNAAYLAVTGNAVMESLRIAALRTQIATVQTLLDQDRKNQRLVREAFAAGSVSRLDIVSADSQFAGDATLLPPLRQQLSVAQHALAIVLGETPAAATPPALDLTQLTLPMQLPVSLPSELAHRRPDILAAEAQLHAATAAVGIATANLYPRITLSASYIPQATETNHLFTANSAGWSLISGLVAPLFDGGRLRAERKAAVDAMLASAANYQQTVLTAFGQVADALQALDHDAQALTAQDRARQAAEDDLTLTRNSYREGGVGVLQVLDAERHYQQASLGYVRAQARRYLDTAQLFLALGGSTPRAAPGN